MKEKTYTPRNYKIDVYDSRDLNGIPLNRIIETRTTITVDKKNTIVNAICLEGLIVVKYRAKRDQDLSDLSLMQCIVSKRLIGNYCELLLKTILSLDRLQKL